MSIISLLRKSFIKNKLFVAYDSGGEDKPVILLLHGIAATHRTWRHLFPRLNEKSYRVVAVDLLGFGKSPKPKFCQYSTEDHVGYLKNTIRSLGINQPITIVAQSMGTLIATRYAAMSPKNIRKLILVSPPIVLPDDDPRLKSYKKAQSKNHSWKVLGEYLASTKRFSIRASALVRKIWREDGAEVVRKNWRSFNRSLRNTIINQSFASDIIKLKAPVIIIYGLLDKIILQSNLEIIAKENNIQTIKITLAHHSVNDAVADAIIAYL